MKWKRLESKLETLSRCERKESENITRLETKLVEEATAKSGGVSTKQQVISEQSKLFSIEM